MQSAPHLVLASTSQYRRALLDRLGIPYSAVPPGVEETRRPDEAPLDLAHRLSREKAQAVAARSPKSVVLGSDQVAALGSGILGKPGTADRCIAQLQAASGQRVVFYTGVCALDTRTGSLEAHVDITTVTFRVLTGDEIVRYVAKDKPLDCAGGFKVESLGVTLFEHIETRDPTALVGLPLIWVASALRRAGIPLP
jgi:septum formation protein